MKAINFIILVMVSCALYAQDVTEKKISSDVKEVTVFLDGAQVGRSENVELLKGLTILKFVKLSPFIDPKSVQVKTGGDITVMSVNHQLNYLEVKEKSPGIKKLEAELDILDDKIIMEQTSLSVVREELVFINSNRNLGGKNEQLNVTNLREASQFYGARLRELKMDEIKRNRTLKELEKERKKLQDQLNTLSARKEYPSGEILVKVDAKRSGKYDFDLSYVVSGAGWFPSYDIRVNSISEPVQLVYKANVKQDTKVDWKNVKLVFSSSDPNVSGVAPELKTYFLDYNTYPPSYRALSGSVNGKVVDENGDPMPGVTVVVEGTTIGTSTDMSGNYSLTVPPAGGRLNYSFIGCDPQSLPITGSTMNVMMQSSNVALEEVVVIGYGSKSRLKSALQGKVAGLAARNDEIRIKGAGSSLEIPVVQSEKQTAVEFRIETPYSIKSENKSYTIELETKFLPALYQHYAVPKIDKDAFLVANITDWEKYDLLEGEAGVIFENTYVGKTLLDVRYATDTLMISLGRDQNVSISREKVEDFEARKFIGTKKEETRGWLTTVKNNRQQEINIIVLDQVPVSTNQEIEVFVKELSGAKHNDSDGEIRWEFNLVPGSKKELELKYSVKYPRNKHLVIE